MNISEYFTLEELTYSSTAKSKGIDNTPKGQDLENLKYTASQMEVVRDVLNSPISISSGFRCDALNKAVGGSSTSAHQKGLAVDFTCKRYGDTKKVVQALLEASRAKQLTFDQLILESPDTPNSWVHIGFKQDGKDQRGEVLTMNKVNGKSVYSKGVN